MLGGMLTPNSHAIIAAPGAPSRPTRFAQRTHTMSPVRMLSTKYIVDQYGGVLAVVHAVLQTNVYMTDKGTAFIFEEGLTIDGVLHEYAVLKTFSELDVSIEWDRAMERRWKGGTSWTKKLVSRSSLVLSE